MSECSYMIYPVVKSGRLGGEWNIDLKYNS